MSGQLNVIKHKLAEAITTAVLTVKSSLRISLVLEKLSTYSRKTGIPKRGTRSCGQQGKRCYSNLSALALADRSRTENKIAEGFLSPLPVLLPRRNAFQRICRIKSWATTARIYLKRQRNVPSAWWKRTAFGAWTRSCSRARKRFSIYIKSHAYARAWRKVCTTKERTAWVVSGLPYARYLNMQK